MNRKSNRLPFLIGGFAAITVVLLLILAAAPPAPIYRNAWTTNASAGPVQGASNLQVTNANDVIWNFFSGGTSTVARIADINAATNALASTNYVNAATNGLPSLFVQTIDGTAATNITTTFTSIIGSGPGSMTMPAGFWQYGRKVVGRFEIQEYTPAAPGICYLEIRFGSTVLNSITYTPNANLTGGPNFLEFQITCRSNSVANGLLQCSAFISRFSGTGAFSQTLLTNIVTTLDTTVSGLVDCRMTNGAAADSFQTRAGDLTER